MDAIDTRALPVRIVQHINIYVCDKIMIFATDEGHGTKVIATMRKPENEKELAGKAGVTLLPLDVTDPDQIKAAARRAEASA